MDSIAPNIGDRTRGQAPISVSSALLAPAVTVRTFRPANVRRILCVFPAYTKAFGTFDHAFPLMGPVKAFMPPQGILLLAALLPREWQVQFVDENIDYARRLNRAGVPTELHVWPGAFHGFDLLPGPAVSDAARRTSIEALRRFLKAD